MPATHEVSILLAQPEHAVPYHQFMDIVFAENLDTLIPPPGPTDLRATSRYVMQHDGHRSALFLAVMGGNLVGAANFSRFDRPEKDHTVGIGLYVRAGYRGQGIGRRLMEAGIAWAIGTPDVDRVELLVMENNATAIGLYESLGFAREGVKLCAIKKPYGYVNVIPMALLLKEAAEAAGQAERPSRSG